MTDDGAIIEFLDDGEVTGTAVEAQGEDAVELVVTPDVKVEEVEATEFLEFHDERGLNVPAEGSGVIPEHTHELPEHDHDGRYYTKSQVDAAMAAKPGIYVTGDWAIDPNNPANGGSLAANTLVVET